MQDVYALKQTLDMYRLNNTTAGWLKRDLLLKFGIDAKLKLVF